METEVQLEQLRQLIWELETCGKKLFSNVIQMDALCAKEHKLEIVNKLRIQCSFLRRQADSCRDMAAVLSRVGNLYEKTEEKLIWAAETDTKQYKETLQVVELTEFEHISVILQ